MLRTTSRVMFTTTLSLTLALLGGAGCQEDPALCERDEDCREGFVCDLVIYKGECVQPVSVITCGERLCQYPLEVCVRDTCVLRSEAPDMEPPLTTPDAWVSADMRVGDAGEMSDMSASDQGREHDMSPLQDSSMLDMSPPQDASIPTDLDPLNRDQGGQECATACDCPPGLACQAGACEALDDPIYCCSGDFCPPDQLCETLEGRRETCSPTVCESACDCDVGLRCEQGSCVLGESPLFCCNSGPCPAGEPCETPSQRQLTCEGSGGGSGACTSACDCPSGQTCDNGTCLFGDSPLFCCGASLCPSGQACEDRAGQRSVCEADSSCASACDCTPGMACEAGSCVLGREPTYCCDDSANCPIDARCQSPVDGRYGVCL